MGSAGAGHRTDQRIVQPEIAGMREVEDGDIGELSRGEHAGFVEAEDARAIGGPPAYNLFNAYGGCTLHSTVGVPGAVHLANHIGGFVRGSTVNREGHSAAEH